MKTINKQMQRKLISTEKKVNRLRILKLFEIVKQVYPARLVKEEEIIITIPHTDAIIDLWCNSDMKIHIEIGNDRIFLESIIHVHTIWEAAQRVNGLFKEYGK